MREISFFQKVYIANEAIDFRKQIHGLSLLVRGQFNLDPLSDFKSLFVFLNKRRTGIKILYWDRTGFALWHKVLEKDKFAWRFHKDTDKKCISSRDLKWLLEGVDISRIKTHSDVHFSDVS